MKTCTQCGQTKPIEGFSIRSKVKGTYHAACKECYKVITRRHYRANSADYKRRSKARRLSYRAEIRRKVFAYFAEHPCVDCGISNPIVLDFDHRTGTNKMDTIAELVNRQFPWEKILEEIAKCDVRCANCHRIRTADQFGWYQYLITTE